MQLRNAISDNINVREMSFFQLSNMLKTKFLQNIDIYYKFVYL